MNGAIEAKTDSLLQRLAKGTAVGSTTTFKPSDMSEVEVEDGMPGISDALLKENCCVAWVVVMKNKIPRATISGLPLGGFLGGRLHARMVDWDVWLPTPRSPPSAPPPPLPSKRLPNIF